MNSERPAPTVRFARQPPFRVVVPTAPAQPALVGRPLHSKRAVRKARNKSCGPWLCLLVA